MTKLGPFNSGDEVWIEPYTAHGVMGFRIVCNGVEQYVYLNPSDGGDSPDVFVYHGTVGEPDGDNPIIFVAFDGSR